MAQFTHLELEELWTNAGGPAGSADVAAAIAEAESGGCSFALAGPADIRPKKECHWNQTTLENSCGLWQINLYAHPDQHAPAIFDPLTNARAAVQISSHGQNFAAWTTYTNGAYRQHLTGSSGSPSVNPPTSSSGQGATGPFAPSAHGGWHAVNVALSRQVPKLLRESYALRHAAERNLARRSRHH